MNYYPNNFYSNYSYGNMYSQPMQAQPQIQPTQPTVPALNGKVVDGPDMVKVTDVPFGSYGIFPKADLSEVYIKSWNSNGTTQVNVYRPVPVEVKEPSVDTNTLILEKMKEIELKLDSITEVAKEKNPFVQQSQTAIEEKSIPEKRKEVKVNAY